MPNEFPAGVSEVITQGRWFASLPPALQQRLVIDAPVRSYARGQFLFRQGDPPIGLFCVLSGQTRHLCSVDEGLEVLMHVGKPGIWTGEYSVVSGRPAISSVVADTPSTTLFVSYKRFQEILEAHPKWVSYFAALVADRFALAFRVNAEAQALPADARLLARLRHLVEHDQPGTLAGSNAHITLSQAQIASLAGVSRQTLSALLRRLESQGSIRVRYKCIELL